MDTGPYNKGKISRYYIARSKETHILLPVNPELGVPEHHEARWVDYHEGAQHGVAAPHARGALGVSHHQSRPHAAAGCRPRGHS